MTAAKKDARTLDQKFNYVVSMAEAIVDAENDKLRINLLTYLIPYIDDLEADLESFIKNQTDCPDYALVQYCNPKFLIERLRLFAKCYDRSRGVMESNVSTRRRLVFDIAESGTPLADLLMRMERLEDLVWGLKNKLSRPSSEAFLNLYGRMDMAANIREHLHDSVVEDMNDWMSRCRKGKPSNAKLAAKRQAVIDSLKGSPVEPLTDVLADQYETREEYHKAAARIYYAMCRDGKQVKIEEFMEPVYKCEETLVWESLEENKPAPTKADEDGLQEMLDHVESLEDIMEEGYAAAHFRQVFEICARNQRCNDYLFGNNGVCYKKLNLNAFEKIVGLMMCNGMLNGGPTQLVSQIFGEESPVYGLQKPGTIRVNISNGQQFDAASQEDLKATIETAINMVKKSKAAGC